MFFLAHSPSDAINALNDLVFTNPVDYPKWNIAAGISPTNEL